MTKTACKKKHYKADDDARFKCSKCDRKADKKKALCKPEKKK